MSVPATAADIERTLDASETGLVLRVRAHSGARRNGVTGVTGVREAELCVAVTAPADRGKANDALTRLLARTLGIARGRVELVAGAANRHKRFAVQGLSPAEAVPAFGKALLAGG